MQLIDGSQAKMVEARLRQLDLHGTEDARPKYERLRSFIAAEVVKGHLRAGTALPSEQQLSDMLRIARTTVRQALAELEKDGVIKRRHGAGTYVNEASSLSRHIGLDVFALVVPGVGTGLWPALQSGLQHAAADLQKQILACNSENDLDRQAHIFVQLIQKRVAGVALAPTSLPLTPAYQVKHLQDSGIPVVFCHRGVKGVDAPLLAVPFREVGRKAGELFVANGHRRAAFFSMHGRSVEASAGYVAGLRETLEKQGGCLPESLMYWGETVSPDVNTQTEALRGALRRMFSDPNPPTAIMASFDPLAERIYLLLGEMGLRVPEDVSIIGFGSAAREGAVTERLTSIVIDEHDIGHRAARVLQEMSDGERPLLDAEKMVVPIDVARGQTLGPA
ncbi:MAG: GntR family transcriptional regulator [Pirellulales bacterium]|nr:GntR family transcriptional regulator [Pirellulales bacterium]